MTMIAALINLIVYLLVLGILIGLVIWIVDAIPLPEPIGRLVKIAVVVLAAIVIIMLLLSLVGIGGNSVNFPKVVG